MLEQEVGSDVTIQRYSSKNQNNFTFMQRQFPVYIPYTLFSGFAFLFPNVSIIP